MEAKLGQEIPFLKSRVLRAATNLTAHPHRFYFKFCESETRSLTKRFQGIAKRWKYYVQELSKGQYSTKQFLVHVVKGGETLTSISQRYGVSIEEIVAVNAKIVDVDLVLEGQHLNIPCSVAEETHMGLAWKSLLPRVEARERFQNSLNLFAGHGNYKILTVPSSHHLLLAKRTGYFLVLVPLIALCIRCIMGAFHLRVAGDLKHQSINESEVNCHKSRSMRWKSALSDMREPDVVDAESIQDSGNPSEDQSQVPFEDLSHAYTKLEPAYQKFLSDCGMSKWGYWRGGSPE